MTKSELEKCIYEYGKDIFSFCRYLTCNLQEAEDLYQDTFLKATELSEKISGSSNPKSYLLSIAVRIWKNRKRKYAWRKRIVDYKESPEEIYQESVLSAEPSPEEALVYKEEEKAVRESVYRLPDRLKTVVLLYYMEEMSIAQIAAAVRIPAGTVKSRLYQARKILEKELEVVLNEERI